MVPVQKLKWFHRVLTTNDYLYKRKVIDSDGCTFCKTEKATISLWDCTYTETFWKHVLEWITKNTPHVRSLSITEQLVIFGVKDDVTTDKTWPNNADGKVLHLQMQMFKNHTKLYLFFERSWAKSSYRETRLVAEGRPNCVFFTMVPVLPADQ